MSRWRSEACWKHQKWKMTWRSPPSHLRHWTRRDTGERRRNQTKEKKRTKRDQGRVGGGQPAWKNRWKRSRHQRPMRRRRSGERKVSTGIHRRTVRRDINGRRWGALRQRNRWKLPEWECRRWRQSRVKRMLHLREMRGRERWRRRGRKRLTERMNKTRRRVRRWERKPK